MSAEPVVALTKNNISLKVQELKEKGTPPKLVALLIGNDPVSRTYVELKEKDCKDVGIISQVIDLSSMTSTYSSKLILEQITKLNNDVSVNAVIPQMPFDGRVSEESLFSLLNPLKDVDGLTPFNLGKLMRKEYTLDKSLLPCTPKGIMYLLDHYDAKVAGRSVVIIGRSILVGETLRKLLQDKEATVTCLHRHSKHVLEQIREADIVVAASGRPPEIFGQDGFRLDGKMVKDGSTVIGVGVRRDPNSNKMLFDVDTKSLKGVCSFLTPNIGGVGAMTRAALMENTVIATESQVARAISK